MKSIVEYKILLIVGVGIFSIISIGLTIVLGILIYTALMTGDVSIILNAMYIMLVLIISLLLLRVYLYHLIIKIEVENNQVQYSTLLKKNTANIYMIKIQKQINNFVVLKVENEVKLRNTFFIIQKKYYKNNEIEAILNQLPYMSVYF